MKVDDCCPANEIVPALAATLARRRDAGRADRVDLVASFDHQAVRAYGEAGDSTETVGYLWTSFVDGKPLRLAEALAEMTADGVNAGLFHFSTLITGEQDVRAQGHRFDLYPWVLDNAAIAAELLRFADLRIISDRAVELAEAIGNPPG